MLNSLKIGGKFLDQPLLVSKFKKAVPKIFVGGALMYGYKETEKAPEQDKSKVRLNTAVILGTTVATSLAAPRIAAKVVNKPYERYLARDIIAKNTELVDTFVKSTKNLSEPVKQVLEKSKTKVLKYSEIKLLDKDLSKTKKGKKFFNTLIPEPENITSKDIISEIGRLSVLGAIPVVGGIAGGLAGEKLTTGSLSKEKSANRVKEGAYQYLANIFMCNVGAAGALGILEKMKVKSKAARVAGMVGGIIATGIVGGSAIANYIGRKVINPIFDKDKNKSSDRRPEVLDICLHSDDIATIAVMSGLKWIEPSLPILYGISGYRAGIGYRNKKVQKTDD